MAKTATKEKKKKIRKTSEGKIFIQASYNNTIVTVADNDGNTIAWSSAGRAGFTGAKKSTPFAAQQVITDLMEEVQQAGFKQAQVYVKGIGSARDAAVRAIGASGVAITMIRDVTPIPHNGPRARKRRRV